MGSEVPKSNEIDIIVGGNTRIYRKHKNIKVRYLAEHIDVSPKRLRQYERGERRISVGKAWQIALVLDIPIQALFSLTTYPSTVTKIPNRNHL